MSSIVTFLAKLSHASMFLKILMLDDMNLSVSLISFRTPMSMCVFGDIYSCIPTARTTHFKLIILKERPLLHGKAFEILRICIYTIVAVNASASSHLRIWY